MKMYHEINEGEGKSGSNVIGRKGTLKRVTIGLTDLLLSLFLMSIAVTTRFRQYAKERRLLYVENLAI